MQNIANVKKLSDVLRKTVETKKIIEFPETGVVLEEEGKTEDKSKKNVLQRRGPKKEAKWPI